MPLQISPGYITIAEAVVTFLGFPALLGGAYMIDKGCCRKPRVAPSSVPVRDGAESSSITCTEDTPAEAPEASPSQVGDKPAETKGGLRGIQRLARTSKEVMEALDSSFKKNGEGESKAASTTMLVVKWGVSAGAIDATAFREIQMAHLQKT